MVLDNSMPIRARDPHKNEDQDIMSDWGIDDHNEEIGLRLGIAHEHEVGSGSEPPRLGENFVVPPYVHTRLVSLTSPTMRMFSNSFSNNSYTNSVISSQSHVRREEDSSVSNTSISVGGFHQYEKLSHDDEEEEEEEEVVLDQASYFEFLKEYDGDMNQRQNEDANRVRSMSLGLRKLIKAEENLRQVFDRFNYSIITCELITIEKKLKFMKLTKNDFVEADAPHDVGKFRKMTITTIFLIISLIRYQIIHGISDTLLALTLRLMHSYTEYMNRESMKLAQVSLNLLNQYIHANFAWDNKLIKYTKHAKPIELVKIEAMLDLMILQYNEMIKKLLPNLDHCCLWKYLNVYQLTDDSNAMDFVWILNSDNEFSSDIPRKDLKQLIQEFIVIRKFYLCCLLTFGETDPGIGEDLMETDIMRSFLQLKFGIQGINLNSHNKVGKKLRISSIVGSLNKLYGVTQYVNDQFDVDNINGKHQMSSIDLGTTLTTSTMDKLINRIDKISTNLRYLRMIDRGEHFDRQISQDLTNLVILYKSIEVDEINKRQKSKQKKNLVLSNPVELKRYSMPGIVVPKRAASAVGSSNSHRRMSSGNGGNAGLGAGLQFSLLNAVLQEENEFSNLRNKQNEENSNNNNDSVILHDMAAHSTMLQYGQPLQKDEDVYDVYDDNDNNNDNNNDDNNDKEEIGEEQGEEEEEEEEEETILNREELKLKLNQTLHKMYV